MKPYPFFIAVHHCENAVAHLLSALQVKLTNTLIQKGLSAHQAHPSLNAIADMLGVTYDVAKPINATPTFFVTLNKKKHTPAFYHLSEMHSLSDLQYFLTN